jgi:chlorite dismutase
LEKKRALRYFPPFMKPQGTPPSIPDLSEKGRDAAGQVISLNRRLFMQLLVFGNARDEQALEQALASSGMPATLYRDINDPTGVGLLTWSEQPEFFVSKLRDFLASSAFSELTLKPAFTMLGRSYSIGYEADLPHVLFNRPIQRATNPDAPWHVWYPLRRKGTFEKLPAAEQKEILSEHGTLGALFSAGDFGNDIRLDCRGLDTNDNDFVIGLIGKELFPLSAMVQAMRKTRQTSEFLERLGPFFIGKAIWQRAGGMVQA